MSFAHLTPSYADSDASSVLVDLTFPNGEHPPARGTQKARVAGVTAFVGCELVHPECCIRLGSRGTRAPFVAMPKAAVHEHRDFRAR
jgi:hypothetical protein